MRRQGRARVPVVLQMEAAECGAASLGMILAYHGCWVPLERLRQDCGISRDGSKALYMMKAAEAHGLASGIKRATVDDLRAGISCPCILHWNRSHFVVLEGFGRGFAWIVDPAHGARRVPMAEFAQKYSGVVLTFSRKADFVPQPRPSLLLGVLRSRLRDAGPVMAFIGISALILALYAILAPVLSRLFVDRVLGQGSDNLMPLIVGGMSLLIFVKLAVEAIQSRQQLHIESYFAAKANASFLWHVLRLPVRFYQYRHIGDIVTRQSENESIAYSLIRQFVPLVLNSVMIVLYIAVLFYYQVWMAAIGLAATVLSIVVLRLSMRRTIELMSAREHDRGHVIGQTYACVEQIETIKASGAETSFFQKWAGYQALENEKAQRHVRMLQFLYGSSDVINGICGAVILMMGAYLIMQEQFTPGMLMAFQGILAIIAKPMQQLSVMQQSLEQMRVSIERMDDIYQVKPDVPEAAFVDVPENMARLRGEIELRGVSFGYNRFEAPLLKDISLRVRMGESVAIVGRSGSGKSTFANLIAGLYKPWEGVVMVDGMPLDDIPVAQLRLSMAVISQENHLFSATIEDNLRMWNRALPFEDIVRAAQDAQVHDLIQRGSRGYQERIIDGGARYSGGQRQQLEIARALASCPSILVMDEATSALDAQTEEAVQRALRARRCTLVVIAHRLSTIRDCDQIVVMDDGRAAEIGTHDSLMALGGLYARLIRSS